MDIIVRLACYSKPRHQIVTTVVEEDVAFGPETSEYLIGDCGTLCAPHWKPYDMLQYARSAPYASGSKTAHRNSGCACHAPQHNLFDEATGDALTRRRKK